MTRLRPVFALGLLVLLLAACGGRTEPAAGGTDTVKFATATLLRVERHDGYTLADVRDAWHPGRLLHRYVLVPRSGSLPEGLPDGTVVRTPLRRVVAFSSVHASLLFDLGCGDRLAGVCDLDYVFHPLVRRAVAEGRAANAGASMKPDVEKIVAAAPDALLVSPFENAGYGAVERLGVPLIECADYMETSALGRAEWMRFFGLLLGQERRADSLYAAVEKRYRALSRQALADKARPSLLTDTKTGSAWFVPAGRSTLSQLYLDAGAAYLFADTPGSGSASLAFETVYAKGHAADLWLVKYGARENLTYAALAADNPLYRRFLPWQRRRVYGCNTLRVPYYEETPFHPDRLLADLVKIFHPGLLPSHKLRYYCPLDE